MTKRIFGLGSVLLFGTTHGIRPSKTLYDREIDSNNGYNGRFWTGWSEWYGCPSFEEIKLNPFGPNAFDRYCAIPNHFKAKAVRYRECTMADGINYDGVTDAMDASSGNDRPFFTDDGVLRSDWSNTVPPSGDNNRLSTILEEMNNGYTSFDLKSASTEYFDTANSEGRQNLYRSSTRVACDPRLEHAAIDCLTDNACDFSTSELREKSGISFRSEIFENQQNFEDWKADASDSDYEKVKDAMVLLIEKAIKDDGNEVWQNAIPSPYDTNMVKEELCEEKCPIALEWSEWSCQCQRGSVLNQDKDLNPAGIPSCDCGTDRRYRVQACKRFNEDTPSCNIYHDPSYVTQTQDATCKNYNFNTEKPERFFLGPEDATRIPDDEVDYVGLLNGFNGIVFGQPNEQRGGITWPTIENMFTKWTSASSFAKIIVGAQEMLYHCQDDKFYDPIKYNLFDESDALQEYAIQYDDCEQDTRWEQWSNWGTCSLTCGGGSQQRTRQCQKKDENGFWVDAPELIGQSCQCQGETEETITCNDNCCPILHTCNPNVAGSNCENDNDFYVSTDIFFKNCGLSCGPETQSAQRRCMCRNSNGQYVQGIDGECAADLDTSADTLILNVNSSRGYRFTRTQDCNNPCCMQWSAWSQAPCSDSCIDCFSTDLSHRTEKTRSCGCVANSGALQPPSTATCAGSASELVICTDTSTTKCCPAYTLWTIWKCTNCIKPRYDDVSKTCSRAPNSTDVKTRSRVCVVPKYTGKKLLQIASTFTVGANGNSDSTVLENCASLPGGSVQTGVCDLPDFARVGPNDSKWCCDVDKWSAWDTCADINGETTCKNEPKDIVGRQTRYRSHICDGPRETVNCPDCLDTRKCDLNLCPRWAEWGDWSGCSQTCSLIAGQNGKRFRTRQCSGVNGQGYLVVDGNEPKCECNEANNPDRFYEQQNCGDETCPKLLTQNPDDPFCSNWIWSDWSSCSTSCGAGTQSRNVRCSNGTKEFDLDSCLNENRNLWFHSDEKPDMKYTRDDLVESRECADKPCPAKPYWTAWDSCRFEGADNEAKCRLNIEDRAFRHRRWICPNGNSDCEQKIDKQECLSLPVCDTSNSPVLFDWTPWSKCNKKCGSGRQLRFRFCSDKTKMNQAPCANQPMKETKDCEDLKPCARFGDWSAWGGCMKHATEERFLRKRDRTCISGVLEQFYCPESDSTEYGPCECVPAATKPAILKQTVSFKVSEMPQEIQDALKTLIETGDSVGESDMEPALLEQLKIYLAGILPAGTEIKNVRFVNNQSADRKRRQVNDMSIEFEALTQIEIPANNDGQILEVDFSDPVSETVVENGGAIIETEVEETQKDAQGDETKNGGADEGADNTEGIDNPSDQGNDTVDASTENEQDSNTAVDPDTGVDIFNPITVEKTAQILIPGVVIDASNISDDLKTIIDSGEDLESNDIYKTALAEKVEEVKSQMPDNVTILNAKLVKISTNGRRKRQDEDQSDFYLLIFDLLQQIVKTIAADEDFIMGDVTTEIEALRLAAENAGATLPVEAATQITTASSDAAGNSNNESDDTSTTSAAVTASTSAAEKPTSSQSPQISDTSTTSGGVTVSTSAAEKATSSQSPQISDTSTTSGGVTSSTSAAEKPTSSQSPQISSASFLNLAVTLVIGNLVARFIL